MHEHTFQNVSKRTRSMRMLQPYEIIQYIALCSGRVTCKDVSCSLCLFSKWMMSQSTNMFVRKTRLWRAWWCSKIWDNPMQTCLKMGYSFKNLPFCKCLLTTGLWGTLFPDKPIYFRLYRPYPLTPGVPTIVSSRKKHVGSVFDDLQQRRYTVSWWLNILAPCLVNSHSVQIPCDLDFVLYLRHVMLYRYCTASKMGTLSHLELHFWGLEAHCVVCWLFSNTSPQKKKVGFDILWLSHVPLSKHGLYSHNP